MARKRRDARLAAADGGSVGSSGVLTESQLAIGEAPHHSSTALCAYVLVGC